MNQKGGGIGSIGVYRDGLGVVLFWFSSVVVDVTMAMQLPVVPTINGGVRLATPPCYHAVMVFIVFIVLVWLLLFFLLLLVLGGCIAGLLVDSWLMGDD
jgi:hypothetical protein